MQLSAILAFGASKPATGCLKTVQLSLILALGGPWGFVLPPAHGAIQSRKPKQAPMVMLCQAQRRNPRRSSSPKEGKPPALNSKAPLDRGVGGRNPKP